MAKDTAKRAAAKALYLSGSELAEIVRRLGVPYATLNNWCARYGWVEEREKTQRAVVAELVHDLIIPKKELIEGIISVGLDMVKKALDGRAETLEYEPMSMMEAKVITSIISDIEKLQALDAATGKDPLEGYAPVTIEQLRAAIAKDPFIEAIPITGEGDTDDATERDDSGAEAPGPGSDDPGIEPSEESPG